MPRGYRSIVLALVGWLILSAAPQNNSATRHKAEPAEGVEQPANNVAAAVNAVQPVPPAEYYRPCEEPYEQRNSDLCTQWKAADSANDSAFWSKWQFIVSSLGLAGLLYTLRITRKGTRAAVNAVEAQIAQERPVMHVDSLKISRVPVAAGHQGRRFLLHLEWHLTNQGKTGCWLEKVCIYPTAFIDERLLPRDCDSSHEFPLVAYVKPDRGWGTKGTKAVPADSWSFTRKELNIIRRDRRVYILGYSIYRDAGGLRWKTEFAYKLLLNEKFEGGQHSPVPSHALWDDRRLDPKKWYQWIWDERPDL